MFDRDNSNFIDINEFNELCKYMGLFLTKDQLVEIFAKSDTDHDKQIDYDQFVKALKYIKMMIALEALQKIGLTFEDMVTGFSKN